MTATADISCEASAGAPAEEIEITSAMIEAGVDVLKESYFNLIDDPELYPVILRNVLEKMFAGSQLHFGT